MTSLSAKISRRHFNTRPVREMQRTTYTRLTAVQTLLTGGVASQSQSKGKGKERALPVERPDSSEGSGASTPAGEVVHMYFNDHNELIVIQK